MAILKIPLRVGTSAKRVDVFHMLCGLPFLFRYHTTKARKLRPLLIGVVIPFPLFFAHSKGCSFNVATRNSYEKTKRYDGKESRQTGEREIGAKK
jgi:hypothetical protein